MKEFNSENDYLSITEFAAIVGVTVEALRHYDRVGVFVPARAIYRGKIKYRYYSPTQITTIKMIKALTEIGVKLKVIKELAENRTPERLLKLLHKHGNIIANEMRFLQNVSSIINTFSSLLAEGISATESEFTVSEEPEKRIILGGINDFSESIGYYREYVRFCSSEFEPKLNLSYPVGGYFDNMKTFQNKPSEPSRFFSLDPEGNDIKPAGLYLIGYARGNYGTTDDLPERMVAFAKKTGLMFSGPVYNTYIFDELSVLDSALYLLQVSASIKEIKRTQSRRPVQRN